MTTEAELHVRDNATEFTVLFGPFPPLGTAPTLGAHDPVLAREVAARLGTVTEVVAEVDAPYGYVQAPADLDRVAVGHWGNVIHVWDPGLATFEIGDELSGEVASWRSRYPEARIVGGIFLDMVSDFTHDVIAVPGVDTLIVSGWDEMEVTGDARAVVRALGGDPETLFSEYIDLDEPDNDLMDELTQLLCVPDSWEGQSVSVFQVRRPHRSSMDEIWLKQT